jgi:hypothetical protein
LIKLPGTWIAVYTTDHGVHIKTGFKMKNILLLAFSIVSFLIAGCDSNANGKVKSASDTSADTIGKHSPYGIDTLNRKRLDSVVNKNDSVH